VSIAPIMNYAGNTSFGISYGKYTSNTSASQLSFTMTPAAEQCAPGLCNVGFGYTMDAKGSACLGLPGCRSQDMYLPQ
jgi:hypothetical protein